MAKKLNDEIMRHFGDGEGWAPRAKDAARWGGKAAGLARMAAMGLPVPPGFMLSAQLTAQYKKDRAAAMALVDQQVRLGYARLGAVMGRAPVVSVRSGAAISMPGMMDTVLNVGLGADMDGHLPADMSRRAKVDCYRRLYQMYGATVQGLPKDKFEATLAAARARDGVDQDSEISEATLRAVCRHFVRNLGVAVPADPVAQIVACAEAVLRSWDSERAIAYRAHHGIDNDLGTAVTVQAMVFGNRETASGSGVAFSRHPSTGAAALFGEYLANAQGEDVVSGTRTPQPLRADAHDAAGDEHGAMPEDAWRALKKAAVALEYEFKDMMDIEFTVEAGKFWLLQCRPGKRTNRAAVRIAHDLLVEGLREARTLAPILSIRQAERAATPHVSGASCAPNWVGIAAGGGAVRGTVVTDPAALKTGTGPRILVRAHTEPDDFEAMTRADGILTAHGGATSHAAVVARAINKPCVVGAGDGVLALQPGTEIVICGDSGAVYVNPTGIKIESGSSEVEALARVIAQRERLLLRGVHWMDAEEYTDPSRGAPPKDADWATVPRRVDEADRGYWEALGGGAPLPSNLPNERRITAVDEGSIAKVRALKGAKFALTERWVRDVIGDMEIADRMREAGLLPDFRVLGGDPLDVLASYLGG